MLPYMFNCFKGNNEIAALIMEWNAQAVTYLKSQIRLGV